MDPDELHSPLRTTLEHTGIRDLPTPCQGVKWSVFTDVLGHLRALRLEQAGYIRYAKLHEERIGVVENAGPGRYRTTRALFETHYRLTDYRTGEPRDEPPEVVAP